MPLLSLLLLLSPAASAQDQKGNASEPASSEQQLLQALALPVAADRYRQSGASEANTVQALQALQSAHVPAHEAQGALDEASDSAREFGATANFGAFVQSSLEAGERGEELRVAIHQEHEHNGNGHAKGVEGVEPEQPPPSQPASPGPGAHGGEDQGPRGEDTTGPGPTEGQPPAPGDQ